MKPPVLGYSLVDAGDGRRLERFGDRLVDRPHPGAFEPCRRLSAWGAADLRFDRGRGWTGRADVRAAWAVEIEGLTLELRATESGGVGLFPEQLLNVEWLAGEIRDRSAASGRPADPDEAGPSVLNLFAHTGLLTLAAARAGAIVTHVDAARGAGAWARRNAELSGLTDRPIRWIVDDAVRFAEREARRDRRYDGILLDPPTYGHSGRRAWRIEVDLPTLLEACAAVASPEPFLLLTGHTTGFDDDWLAGALTYAFPAATGRITAEPLELGAESGTVLRLGTGVRASR